mgnify:CR=1 FL=1
MLKKVLIVSFIATFVNSCGGGLGDAGKVLRNEKITNKDEFLVKKKDPLILPPDYNTIPKPKSINQSNQQIDNNKKITEILKIPDGIKKSSSKVTTAEKSILDKIKKWIIKI